VDDAAVPSSPSLSTNSKKWLGWIGSGLALAGLLFLVFRLQEYRGQLDWSVLSAWQWLALVLLSLIYGVLNVFLVFSWRDLLHLAGHASSQSWAVAVYGKSQVAKYMPGNIFHLAGRQALGLAAGAPSTALAKSIFWELILLAAAGACVALLSLPLFLRSLTSSISVWLAAIVFSAGIVSSVIWVDRRLASAFAWQTCFFVAAGFIFAAILALLGLAEHAGTTGWLQVTGAYALAWLAGFVMPGAPAGLGIREAVLLLLLGPTVSEGGLLVAVVLSRAVTAVGDLFFFALSLWPVSRRPMIA
jgi:uncharacterized membrane protein YbhN (UPF0104 family)